MAGAWSAAIVFTRVQMLEVRRRLQKYAPMRVGVRNAPSFNFGAGGRYDIDFNLRGPDIVALAGLYTGRARGNQRSASRAGPVGCLSLRQFRPGNTPVRCQNPPHFRPLQRSMG